MLNFKRLSIGFVVTLMATSTVFANNNSTVTSSTTVVQQPKKEGRRWSGFVDMSRSTSLYDFEDGTRSDGMDYSARFNLKINNEFSMSLRGGYSQDLNYPENDDFSDTSFTVQRVPFRLGKRFLMGYRVGATAPTSKDSKTRQSLMTSLSAGVNLLVNPDYLIKGFQVAGLLTAGRNLHQYDTALDGRVNTQYSSNQNLTLTYAFAGFADGLYVSSSFLHRNAWSYQGVMRDSFEMTQDIGYEFNSTFSASVGHTNSGSTLKPNGQDSNVELISDKTSMVYGSVTVVF